jgi:hypothetical protein
MVSLCEGIQKQALEPAIGGRQNLQNTDRKKRKEGFKKKGLRLCCDEEQTKLLQ